MSSPFRGRCLRSRRRGPPRSARDLADAPNRVVAAGEAGSGLAWNDVDHAVEAEELVAWMQHERSQAEESEPEEVPAAADEAPVEE